MTYSLPDMVIAVLAATALGTLIGAATTIDRPKKGRHKR